MIRLPPTIIQNLGFRKSDLGAPTKSIKKPLFVDRIPPGAIVLESIELGIDVTPEAKKTPEPGEHALRERKARHSLQADAKDIQARAELANALMSQNRLQDASVEFSKVAEADHTHAPAHKALAAIANQLGHRDRGRRIMQDFFVRCPIEPGSDGLDHPKTDHPPAILQIRGFDQTHVLLSKRADGSIKTKLRGGHFTTKFLLLDPPFQVHRFTIARRNILQPGILPPHSVVLNTIADADLEATSLETLKAFLVSRPDIPVINRPEQVAETARDRNAARFRAVDGLTFPRTERVRFKDASADTVARTIGDLDFTFPFLIRQAGTHTGRSFALIKSREDLDGYVGAALNTTYFVINYRPILWNGRLFRKLRLFSIDGQYFPVVCHLDRVWNVHGGNRKTMMLDDEALMAEEKRFLQDWRSYIGAHNVTCLEEVKNRVNLEFFGVDFTLDEEGKIFVYELNPAMRHSFDHGHNFPYKLPYDHAISDAFEAMIQRRLSGHERIREQEAQSRLLASCWSEPQ